MDRKTNGNSVSPFLFGGRALTGMPRSIGHQQDVNISLSQLKDHLDASFSLALNAQIGKLGFYGDAGYMKFSGGFAGPLGGNTSADLKFVIADAGVSYLLVKTGEEHPFLLAGTAGGPLLVC